MPTTKSSEALVLVSKQNGLVVIPAATPLTMLNYFDGKFLRASDLKTEQTYLRQLVALSNQAGSAGVVHGYDVTLGAGDTLNIGPGLAIDPAGRVILLPQDIALNVQELITKSLELQNAVRFGKTGGADRFGDCEIVAAAPGDSATPVNEVYVITISPAEALCGEEDVFGKLCEEACATSTDRPFFVEGLIVRALPLRLRSPLPASKAVALTRTHLRSRIAAAYYEDERQFGVASLISRAGLAQQTWCLGADAAGGNGVPIGVIARAGANTTLFLDPWIVRRERIDTPPKRYWQWRMMMRPWDVFLAQILQFQCQLRDLVRTLPSQSGDVDPCGGALGAINEAALTITEFKDFYETATQRFTNLRVDEAPTFEGGLSRLIRLNDNLVTVGQRLAAPPLDRLLIRGGIIELPSAGYLPVVPGAALTVNKQVRLMMGEGVNLRFCVVRPDYVAHALEEVQHMERISLIQGLDNPLNKPDVDILVPNGLIIEEPRLETGRSYEATANLFEGLLVDSKITDLLKLAKLSQARARTYSKFQGAARSDTLPTGGAAFYLSGLFQETVVVRPVGGGVLLDDTGSAAVFERGAAPPAIGLWFSFRGNEDVFALKTGSTTGAGSRTIVASLSRGLSSNTAALSSGTDSTLVSTPDATTLARAASTIFSLVSTTIKLDLEFNGQLRITQQNTRQPNGDQIVRGRIVDASFVYRGAAFVPPNVPQRAFADLDVTFIRRSDGTVEISLDHGVSLLKLEIPARQTPLQIKPVIFAKPDLDDNTPEGALAGAVLNENANVLLASNERHIQAHKALEVVGRALNDLSFVDTHADLLFPPPTEPLIELVVQGTMDWVLFHRRRTKQCTGDKPITPPPPRTYEVWHLPVESADQAISVRTALQRNDTETLSKLKFVQVNLVEFGGGAATLLTSNDAIRADWNTIPHGDVLVYDAIASQSAAFDEGADLAANRLGRLEQTVVSLLTLKLEGESDVLPVVPTPFQDVNVDGAIILLTVKTSVDLSITNTDSPDPVVADNNLTYTLTVTNLGSGNAENVRVIDTLAEQTEFSSAASNNPAFTIAHSNGVVTCTAPALAKGATAVITIVVHVKAETPHNSVLSNTATVSATTSDTITANDTAVATTTVINGADLSITKNGEPATVAPGKNLSYTLKVHNGNGSSDAEDVIVVDTLPVGTGFVSVTAPGYKVTSPKPGSGGTITLVRGTPLGAGQSDTLSVVVSVLLPAVGGTAVSSLSNTATVSSSTFDPGPGSNSATVVTPVTRPQRTALVIFSEVSAAGVHSPLQGAAQSRVTFIDNVPNSTELQTAFDGQPSSFALVQFGGITMADVVAPLDSDIQVRLDAVFNALKNAGGSPSATRKKAALLSAADNTTLANRSISITGVDEVVFLELGAIS
ncbi:MAG: DUF11 domain-containing protein [Acidobacteriota bacterium]